MHSNSKVCGLSLQVSSVHSPCSITSSFISLWWYSSMRLLLSWRANLAVGSECIRKPSPYLNSIPRNRPSPAPCAGITKDFVVPGVGAGLCLAVVLSVPRGLCLGPPQPRLHVPGLAWRVFSVEGWPLALHIERQSLHFSSLWRETPYPLSHTVPVHYYTFNHPQYGLNASVELIWSLCNLH